MKIQENFDSFYIFPEIPQVQIFRYSDICSDIYNIYSPPKFFRICTGYSTRESVVKILFSTKKFSFCTKRVMTVCHVFAPKYHNDFTPN